MLVLVLALVQVVAARQVEVVVAVVVGCRVRAVATCARACIVHETF